MSRSPVLVVSQLPPPVHGSTVMTRNLIAVLDGLGLRPRLVDRRFSRTVDDVGRAGAGKLAAIPSLVRRLGSAIDAERPAVCVFFLTNRPGSFLVDVLLVAVLRSRRVPVIHYVHTNGYRELAGRGPFWRLAVARVLRAADRVVVLGPSLGDDVTAFVRPGVVVVVPNPVEPPADAPAQEPVGSTVAFLSNLLPEKGVDAFVRVAAAVVSHEPERDWRFEIAGAGDDSALERVRGAVREHGLEGRVVVHGAVDATARDAMLARSDVLVFPSTYRLEAQPLSILEAMAVGVPVVAYDIGGVGDLVRDDVTGTLVEPGDETGLASAVLRITGDDAVRARLAVAARERYLAAHTPAAYRDGWQRLLAAPPNRSRPNRSRQEASVSDFASTWSDLRHLVAADWRANPRDYKSRAVLLAFRLAQRAMGTPDRLRLRAVLPVALYRLWTEAGIGLELRPRTRVGGGLTVFHGYGLVVNDHAVIGSGVVLRNGVTIGQKVDGGPSPRIGDDVRFGAGAIVLGDITIGDGAVIGAGAVVLKDVPPGRTVVGNPARVLEKESA